MFDIFLYFHSFSDVILCFLYLNNMYIIKKMYIIKNAFISRQIDSM